MSLVAADASEPQTQDDKREHSKALFESLIDPETPLWVVEDAGAMARIDLVREGVPANILDYLPRWLGLSRERLLTMLGLPRATIDRKLREHRVLSQDESERVLGLIRLFSMVERMMEESSQIQKFDSGRWLGSWLDRPNPALGGRRPGSLIDTVEGRDLVGTLVSRMQSGAYS